MIRQAVSCDICGAEKKQTNHWFVACEQGGELRVTGWNSRLRLRAGAKHLCGQTCLHKLVDEFMARTLAGRPAAAAPEPVATAGEADTSLTSPTAYGEVRSIAKTEPANPAMPAAIPAAPRPMIVAPAPMPVPMAPQLVQSPLPAGIRPEPANTPAYNSRRWTNEAWERERKREMLTGKDVAHKQSRRGV